MKEEKLMTGLRVQYSSFAKAGMYKLAAVEHFGEKLVLDINSGSPEEYAYREAERLAIVVDAEFVVNGKITRKTASGEYWKDKEANKNE